MPQLRSTQAALRGGLAILLVLAPAAGGLWAVQPRQAPQSGEAASSQQVPRPAQAPLPLQAGQHLLERFFHPTLRGAFLDPSPSRFSWTPAGDLLEQGAEKAGRPFRFRVTDPRGGRVKAEGVALAAALAGAGLPENEARQALAGAQLVWSPEGRAFLLPTDKGWFRVEPGTPVQARRLELPRGAEEPLFSPEGRHLAFLVGNDLHVMELASGKVKALTTDGSPDRFNGRLDWVYDEEIYGRGSHRAFQWSPDGGRLAFLRLDEGPVPTYQFLDDRFQPQKIVRQRYPKAGEPNPLASLVLVDLEGRQEVLPAAHPGEDTLITQLGWDPQGRPLICLQDRTQTWLELLRFEGGKPRLLIREKGGPIQESLPLPRFLPDGSFLWLSDRTGFRHLHRYDAQGRDQGALTRGAWDVRELVAVDPGAQRLWFLASLPGTHGRNLHVLDLAAGGAPRRLSTHRGVHTAAFSPDHSLLLDTWSDATRPSRTALCEAGGKELKVLADSMGPDFRELEELRLPEPRFRVFKARDGQELQGLFFAPLRQEGGPWPVYQAVYGGPTDPAGPASQVVDAWTSSSLWYRFLASQGIAVWVVDNRSASGKGIRCAQGVHGALGRQELQDQEDALAWIQGHEPVDGTRAVISGWSYGGFLASYALTHSGAWKLGIAGAPVTDWKLYDSVYTERYMGLPRDNAEGYAASSVVAAAGRMQGRLLLLHGTLDDNVHPQNTIQLADALQKAGKGFELVLFPGAGHGPRTPEQTFARYRAFWEFLGKWM